MHGHLLKTSLSYLRDLCNLRNEDACQSLALLFKIYILYQKNKFDVNMHMHNLLLTIQRNIERIKFLNYILSVFHSIV